MTYKNEDRPAPGDAPALPEITPEMIEAGVLAFYDWDSRVEEASGLVVQIFQAMAAARSDATSRARPRDE